VFASADVLNNPVEYGQWRSPTVGTFGSHTRESTRAIRHAAGLNARRLQRTVDRLGLELVGQPIALARERLQAEWRRTGGFLTEPRLTEYAQALVEGRSVTIASARIHVAGPPARRDSHH
jgi:hypothetical protein